MTEPSPDPPGQGPAGPPRSLEDLAVKATQVLRDAGVEDPERLAPALLDALGLPVLLARLAVAARIVTAADTYHPVASFFVEGSDERRFILEVLGR
ncbi:hypothetical protein [Aciditerrimonas ferrireducens]|jgi:hypothetical protein|uniref:hypothetical protein n=1 Tax=Aciditerrimonas ferrireducens TaxID=667306 RepID=UPI0020030507|nr:hypothetical protein [Aciditerrimonas ferrireducens]MCK4177155.1 hypothetical protein [Aciditerrimonas ferrireducens]